MITYIILQTLRTFLASPSAGDLTGSFVGLFDGHKEELFGTKINRLSDPEGGPVKYFVGSIIVSPSTTSDAGWGGELQ